ncbi:MAG: hypothetical protein M3220_20505 [Chloroflexota bacterium]|nr:hypothetical protein [Chloroflexota bacterium]
MAKKKSPQIPKHLLASSLRPRIEAAWRDEALPEQEEKAIVAMLDDLARGVDERFLLSTMLRAFSEAPSTVQGCLREPLPTWLQRRGHLDTLQEMVADLTLEPELQEVALAWLAAAGVEVERIEVAEPEDLYYDAYVFDNGAQAHLALLWYTDARRKRVSGLGFLIDLNPPWEGAIKDAMRYPVRSPQGIVSFISGADSPFGLEMVPISRDEAIERLLEALDANRSEGIRLHRDLISHRRYFAEHVLPILNEVEPGSFSMEDFDELSRTGESPVELNRQERMFGYRTRLEDGTEIRILRDPDDDEFF